MTKYTTFEEYLNNKKKMQEKPPVEEVPDYHGDSNKTPELKDNRKNIKNKKQPQVVEVYKSFKEYLNGKGIMQDKAVVDKIGDQVDMPSNRTNAPAAADKKGDNWIDPESTGDKPAPYKASGEGNKGSKQEAGLGDMGDRKLRIDYETDVDSNSPYGGPKAASWNKTEAFFHKTKDMNTAEFTKHIIQECGGCGCGDPEDDHSDDTPFITVYRVGKVQPDPHETIRYISKLAKENPTLRSSLIREMKRNDGGMNLLMDEMMNHPESYNEVARILDGDDGPSSAKKLVGALNDNYSKYMDGFSAMYDESVAKPFHDVDDDDEDDDNVDMEKPVFGPDDEDDMGNDMGNDTDEPEMPNGDTEEEDDDDGLNDLDLGNDEPAPKKLPKPKKKFGYNNVLEAMKNHDYMMEAMKGYL